MTEFFTGLGYCAAAAIVTVGIFALIGLICSFRLSGRMSREEEMETDIAGAIEGDLTNFATGLKRDEAA